jgi:hypothetical protein
MDLATYIKWRTDPVRLAAIEERKKAAKAKALVNKEKAKAFDTVRKAQIKEKADFLIRQSEDRVQQILSDRAAAEAAAQAAEEAKAAQAAEQAKKALEAALASRTSGKIAEEAQAAEAKAATAAQEAKEAQEAQSTRIAGERQEAILQSPKFKKLTKKAQVRFVEEGLGPEDLCKRDVLVALEVAARR